MPSIQSDNRGADPDPGPCRPGHEGTRADPAGTRIDRAGVQERLVVRARRTQIRRPGTTAGVTNIAAANSAKPEILRTSSGEVVDVRALVADGRARADPARPGGFCPTGLTVVRRLRDGRGHGNRRVGASVRVAWGPPSSAARCGWAGAPPWPPGRDDGAGDPPR